MSRFKHLERAQLEASIVAVRGLPEVGVPPQGWIRTVRGALGMSIRQLGERVGLSKSSVAALEKRETSDAITLESLRRLADALESDLWYAIVPRRPVEELVVERARAVAERIVADVMERMEFEMREVPEAEIRSMVEHHTREALQKSHRLWDGGRPQKEDRLARARRILGLDAEDGAGGAEGAAPS